MTDTFGATPENLLSSVGRNFPLSTTREVIFHNFKVDK